MSTPALNTFLEPSQRRPAFSHKTILAVWRSTKLHCGSKTHATKLFLGAFEAFMGRWLCILPVSTSGVEVVTADCFFDNIDPSFAVFVTPVLIALFRRGQLSRTI